MAEQARGAGALRTLAYCHSYIGTTEYLQGKFADARASLERSAALYREINTPSGEAMALQRLGVVRTAVGEWEQALADLHRALEIARWGDEETVRERLRDGIKSLQLTRQLISFKFSLAVPEVVEFWRAWYGPTQRAFAALDENGQQALRRDLEHLWSEHNAPRMAQPMLSRNTLRS
jgi:hypothetical protein